MGAFDGLHLGHQALIDAARARGRQVAVVTFDPHPAQVIAPQRAPKLLYGPVQRARVLDSLGVEHLVLLPFDREMSSLPPDAFARRFLLDGLRPCAMAVGRDFRFGANRAGDVGQLRMLLARGGIALEVVDPVPMPTAAEPTSEAIPHKLGSTDVRKAIDAGAVDRAGLMLGRWHSVAGVVETGARRGRTIGFPTANLGYEHAYLPPLGVYATALSVWDPSSPDYGTVWPAVTNVGRNPTFTDAGAPVTVETHVLDRDLGDQLYGVEIEVSFIAHLRSEVKFSGPEALIEQIRRDVEAARAHLTPEALAKVLRPSP